VKDIHDIPVTARTGIVVVTIMLWFLLPVNGAVSAAVVAVATVATAVVVFSTARQAVANYSSGSLRE
jgi:hypothetical protein